MDTPRAGEAASPTGETPIVTRGMAVTDPSIRALVDDADRPRGAWLAPETSIALRGAAATVTPAGGDRFESVRRQASELFERSTVADAVPHAARPRLFGGFAFHDGDRPAATPWEGFADAWFLLPAVQLTAVDDGWWLTVTAAGPDADSVAERRLEDWSERLATDDGRGGAQPDPGSETPGVVGRERTPSRDGWRSQVSAALDRIDRGELEKVVLAQSLSLAFDGDLREPAVLDSLGGTYPDCYRFLLSPPEGGTFFGATPERLVSRRGRTVRTEALAGSTGRGDTPAEDEWLAAELTESEKDRHEHELVVDAIRDQLAPVASSVSTGPLSVRRLATVQHLETAISAELNTDDHVLSLVEALHPTPAVGGLPPDAALATITETEAFDRGWYAAPVGWFDAAGNGTFAVAIRSALSREGAAHLFAGAGIVADSDPDREWDEVQLKYRPMLDELE